MSHITHPYESSFTQTDYSVTYDGEFTSTDPRLGKFRQANFTFAQNDFPDKSRDLKAFIRVYRKISAVEFILKKTKHFSPRAFEYPWPWFSDVETQKAQINFDNWSTATLSGLDSL